MMFRCLFSSLYLFSVASAQLRSLADPKTVRIKDCTPKDGVPFYSQYFEDRIVYENFFTNKCGGTVVEMGGFDGRIFSNSWYYEYALGWKTLLVEAFPDNFAKMKVNRPDAINVFGAICLGETIDFLTGSHIATGGIANDMSERHKKEWTDEKAVHIQVPCTQVNKLFTENNIDHVDIFFLDVEGGELAVLHTIDWGKVQIDVFVIEMDGTNPLKEAAIRAILKAYGYVTPFSMRDECKKIQWQCMPSELFVLEHVLEQKLK